jgi:hypothetical protein
VVLGAGLALAGLVQALAAEPRWAPLWLPLLGLLGITLGLVGAAHLIHYPWGYGLLGGRRAPAPDDADLWLSLDALGRSWRVTSTGLIHRSPWLGDFFVPFSRIQRVAPYATRAHLFFVVDHDCPWLRRRLAVPGPVADLVSALLDGERERAARLAACSGNPAHLSAPSHWVRGASTSWRRWRLLVWLLGLGLLASLYQASGWFAAHPELDWLQPGRALGVLFPASFVALVLGDMALACWDSLRRTQLLLYPDRLWLVRPRVGGVEVTPEELLGYSVWSPTLLAVHAPARGGGITTRVVRLPGDADRAAVCAWFDERQLPRLDWGVLRSLRAALARGSST